MPAKLCRTLFCVFLFTSTLAQSSEPTKLDMPDLNADASNTERVIVLFDHNPEKLMNTESRERFSKTWGIYQKNDLYQKLIIAGISQEDIRSAVERDYYFGSGHPTKDRALQAWLAIRNNISTAAKEFMAELEAYEEENKVIYNRQQLDEQTKLPTMAGWE